MARSAGTPEIIGWTYPHDCPSACALEAERLTETEIGKVRGARNHSYTAGVICAKVARYRDRVHHTDRFTKPLLRIGDKGIGREAFAPIGWEEALDRVAEALTDAADRYGPETDASRTRAGRPAALFHAKDLAELNLREVNRVRLGNTRGSELLHARSFDGQQRGVVVVEGVWPNNAFLEGIGINVLIGSDPAPPKGGGAFNVTAIWVRAE